MPRDSNGNYTLPSGNPVVTGTTIESSWANSTMDDIRQALTDSLDRFGRGGMQAPFRFVDGTQSGPGMSWASELSTGFYRAGTNDMRATVAGLPQMRWTGTGVDVWDSVAAQWVPITGAAGANFARLNAANVFTAANTFTSELVVNNATPAIRLLETDGGTDRNNWRWVADGGIAFFQLRNDANDTSSVAFRVASSPSAFGVQSVNVGNLTSVTTLNLQSPVINAGLGTYLPVVAGNAALLGVHAATGRSEIGVSVTQTNVNLRAGLFVDGPNSTTGLDWVFSSGVNRFEFRRAGVEVFGFNQTGVTLVGGTRLAVNNAANSSSATYSVFGADAYLSGSVTSYIYQLGGSNRFVVGTTEASTIGTALAVMATNLADGFVFAPPAPGGANGFLGRRGSAQTLQADIGLQLIAGRTMGWLSGDNTRWVTFQIDNSAAAYFNAAAAARYQWYVNNFLHLTAEPTGLTVRTNNASSVANDLYVLRTGGAGGNAAGQNAWIQLWNETQAEGWGLQVGTTGEHALRFYGFSGGWAERIRFNFSGISLYSGGGLSILSPDNLVSYQLRLATSANSQSPIFSGRGALLWFHDPTYAYGGVFVSTSAAPSTGGTPGQIWLQV